MIRINLLPHREEAKKARREQFFVLAGLVSVLGALIVFAVYTLIGGAISNQDNSNNFLKGEIAVLDKQLDQIKRLKEQTQALLSRKQVIENLQRDRGETVYLLSELVKQVPEGIYLRSLVQTGPKLVLSGVAQSNARITTLMNNLDDSPLLENSTLIETKSEVINNRRLNGFSITTSITRQTTDASAASKPGRKP